MRTRDTRQQTRGPIGPVVAAGALALVLAGCASLGQGAADGQTGAPPGSSEDPRDEPTEIPTDGGMLLQVAHVGGFVPVGHGFSTVPEITLYSDGLAITQGPTTLEYPGRVLPNLRRLQLDADEVAGLVRSAHEADLDTAAEYGTPPIADAGATELRFTVDGRTVVHHAEALDLTLEGGPEGEPPTSGLTDEEIAARQTLATYLDELRSTVQAAEDVGAYEPDTFAVLARPVADDAADTGIEPEPLTHPWPTDVPLGTECTLVEGQQATQLADTLADARHGDLFVDDGALYEVWVRVLLPGEAGCDAGARTEG